MHAAKGMKAKIDSSMYAGFCFFGAVRYDADIRSVIVTFYSHFFDAT